MFNLARFSLSFFYFHFGSYCSSATSSLHLVSVHSLRHNILPNIWLENKHNNNKCAIFFVPCAIRKTTRQTRIASASSAWSIVVDFRGKMKMLGLSILPREKLILRKGDAVIVSQIFFYCEFWMAINVRCTLKSASLRFGEFEISFFGKSKLKSWNNIFIASIRFQQF